MAAAVAAFFTSSSSSTMLLRTATAVTFGALYSLKQPRPCSIPQFHSPFHLPLRYMLHTTDFNHHDGLVVRCLDILTRGLRFEPHWANIMGGGKGKGSKMVTGIPRTMSRVSATHDEEASARAAATEANTGAPTIFDKIISKEIPSSIVYEDEKVLAFHDINPQAPVHVLVIPKLRDGLTELGKAEPKHEDILGHLLHASKIVAEKEGIVDGFRVVINSGATACQSDYHLHLHVLGGRQMKWPPG